MRPAIEPPTEGAEGPPGAIASRLFTRIVRLSESVPYALVALIDAEKVPELLGAAPAKPRLPEACAHDGGDTV